MSGVLQDLRSGLRHQGFAQKLLYPGLHMPSAADYR